ncbi:cilia- and flagella-associated protein 251-like [Juglans microcarpa x Juglans regia]|uniref:cilia- and flagella-associated protein 251-like n=1 Tax=Juglans microcarpa x Juglans regia TaxID=2249226 RepID=UPI001B7F5B84|nr:cilia- and flagella-associated protein 251-like [Juglans microcarpa x Juglans regia]XP_041013712.1 cilia- and flagella-associated protein 251-like [Juglans microcarpa x Juglans regia]
MIKRSPSRNHRSKGIKVKHVLQICLLLGVCFWLIYQVKHSHDKKKEFDEKDAKLSVKTQSGSELLKLGRKDIHPHLEEVPEIEKHVEEEEEETGGEEEENKHDEEEREEEENKHEEKEQDEEENKHEVEDQEEEENKSEEIEEIERGAGDDEMDENDQEKLDGDADHDEELLDEEKEGEEEDKESERNESDNKESQVETSLEDQDRDGGNHEAREEHYKGDDASSAVTHDAQTIISEADKLSSGNSIEISEMNILGQENKSNDTQETDTDQNNPAIKVVESEIDSIGTSLNAITIEQKGNNGSSNSVDGLVENSTRTAQSTGQPEASNDTTLVSKEVSNNSDEVSTDRNNSTDTGIGTSGFSQQNGTVNISDLAHAQNITADLSSVQTLEMEQNGNSTSVSESNQSDVNSTVSIKIEKADAGARESSTSSNTMESALSEKITTETEDGSVSSTSKENTDATKNKADGKSELGRTNESSDNSSRDEVPDAVEHNPVDASNSHITLNEKVDTDLDKMPEIRTEGENGKAVAAE